ncbi:MAG: hypothetical protein FJ078_08205 [Cyanobacteria bacterium K_DeepCast_35m_m2_155]|nr:hypothetical protein [Cyanobacteria bacterium K_DeepCast_35m_m2_155]
MAANPLDTLRLKLMQDVLPVGVAVAERARKGGFKDVVAAFSNKAGGADPLAQLRDEGEPLASQLRSGLDRLSPGLGNPVMKVDVRVEPGSAMAEPNHSQPVADQALLLSRLAAVEQRLAQLESALQQPS